MFDADLSEQHASKFGGTVTVKSKDTTWSTIYGSTLTVTSNGAFTGMDLGGGGAKPPKYNPVTNSARGINLFTIVDDVQYQNMNAFPIKKNGDADTNIYTKLGKIVETSSDYLVFFASEKSQNFELNDLDTVYDIGFVSVSKALSSTSKPVWITSLDSESA